VGLMSLAEADSPHRVSEESEPSTGRCTLQTHCFTSSLENVLEGGDAGVRGDSKMATALIKRQFGE
jgi:hypothetical protein